MATSGIDVPENATVISRLEIVRYMDETGEIHPDWVSCDETGVRELDIPEILYLLEWTKATALAPLHAAAATKLLEYRDGE